MRCLVVLSLLLLTFPISAAELAQLTSANWDRLAPEGKEADCILGDFAFRSDRVMAVVAQPLPTRHANLTVRQVGGAVIDLTVTDRPNDQLSAFYPGRRVHVFTKASILQAKGPKVVLKCEAPAQPANAEKKTPARPAVQVYYELHDGLAFLLVRSVFTNTFQQPLTVSLEDDLRLDDVETRSPGGASDLFWSHDKHFEQAYALLPDAHRLHTRSTLRESVVQYLVGDGKNEIELKPGESYTLVRRLFPGPHLLAVKGEVAKFRGEPTVQYGWRLVDPHFKPVIGGEVILKQDERIYGTGRSDDQGWIKALLPLKEGKFSLTCKSIGRPSLTSEVDLSKLKKGDVLHAQLHLEKGSEVEAIVTDEKGRPLPCKVAFKGIGDTVSPNWGPPAAREAVVNLFYSVHGRFTVPIAPGTYEATVTYGPKYDMVRVPLKVEKGRRTPLRATLRRAYDTPGWVSADFHSHSSPSGDNTADQRGRVLNLICENVEFAPCTEHNRIDSYVPHLKALGAEKLLGTCCGIELTGTPLPLNHHNAFPLEWKPRTQDGGAPVVDLDPQVQIRRLAEWGDPAVLQRGERLVQQNHPDIGWLFFDKDGDGKPDGGYKGGFPYMHVIEVHPIHEVLEMQPTRIVTNSQKKKVRLNNCIFNWLQLLNQGYRIPGVVNTDAHYNYHGSGGLRIFVRSDATVPGDIDPLEIVRHARQGHIIMSTGPYLEVKLGSAIPGDDVLLKGGKGELEVKACCNNWLDIDRIQVLVNGRPDPKLNFTRSSHPHLFRDKSGVRFQHRIPFQLERDAHLIVVASGNKEIGDIVGPLWGRYRPTAISNPIYVDVDGGGFTPNRDTLDQPLPVKSMQEVK